MFTGQSNDVRQPGSPDASPGTRADEQCEATLREDEHNRPDRGRRQRPGERAQFGVCGEHLPAAGRVRLAVRDADVVGRSH